MLNGENILAFDFGLSRIGVAIGNSLIKIPHPLDTITGANKFVKLEKVSKIISKWDPKKIVLGVPSLNVDLTKHIIKFKNRLEHNFKIPVIIINEDFTSFTASIKLDQRNIKGIMQKSKIDQLAACEILETYFNLSK